MLNTRSIGQRLSNARPINVITTGEDEQKSKEQATFMPHESIQIKIRLNIQHMINKHTQSYRESSCCEPNLSESILQLHVEIRVQADSTVLDTRASTRQ